LEEGRRQTAGGRTLKSTQTVCPKQVKHVHVWLLDQWSPCTKRWERNSETPKQCRLWRRFKSRTAMHPLIIV